MLPTLGLNQPFLKGTACLFNCKSGNSAFSADVWILICGFKSDHFQKQWFHHTNSDRDRDLDR